MKFNKWTLGLAAVGAVSMASAVRADDAPKMSALNTALSNTTISGYVSTSVNWLVNHTDDGDSVGEKIPLQAGKADGFNLDVVKLVIAKPEDQTEWASGYEVDLLFGPDAAGYNNSVSSNTGSQNGQSEVAIQQAFVTLRTPVGSGIDWKIGVWNTVIGYESFDAGSNPNYTRSWGWAVEPTEHTGILASYNITSALAVSAGVANTLEAGINVRNTYNNTGETTSSWDKTFLGSATYTAPSTWGWASGSAFYAGMVYGFAGGLEGAGGSQGGNQQNYYLGTTLNSPWSKLTFGGSFDYVQNLGGTTALAGGGVHLNDYVFGLYSTYKATDKLSFNTRGEYWEVDGQSGSSYKGGDAGIELSEDLEYDLWANVQSRIEVRYDKATSSVIPGESVLPTGALVSEAATLGIYANIIYKF
jgi:hypothetical protein